MDRKYQNQWRNQRNFSAPFGAMQYSISNYSTESKSKSDLAFADEMLLHNLHLMPNPLQKNLADTMASVRAESPPKAKAFVEKSPESAGNHYYPSFTGIGSFFSGVFSVLSGGLFQRRKSVYHDCFDESPPDWHASNREDLNKAQPTGQFAGEPDMSDCRSAVAHCEDKLNRVRLLLTNPPQTPSVSKLRRRPRKVFVEPGSVEENFQDAFTEADFERFGSEPHIECFSAINNHKEELMEAAAPKMKIETLKTKETPVIQPENKPIEVVKDVDEVDACKIEELKIDAKPEVIASCEDKVSKLKALLQSRNTRRSRLDIKPDSNEEPAVPNTDDQPSNRTKCVRIDKPQDKHYKNPNRSTDKRKKSQIMRNINDDMSFGTEVEVEDISSPDNSPLKPTKLCDIINICPKLKEHTTKIPEPLPSKEYFDEVSGRFHSTSTTDSEDSFQIVFADSPKATRSRAVSDCDSEDSFIVFEDSPDSCYTSHDVFGDSEVSDDDMDSESDISDSGCGVSCKLNGSMSRTIADLTDDSLFDDTVRADSDSDDLDSAVTVCEELPPETEVKKSTGLLIDDAKKLLRRQQPPKKVQFSTQPPKVHVMRVWAFAARQARAGHWEQHALDRDRFKRKIADVDMAVSWVLKPQHRSRVMFQRFMPWWNAQRRLEIAERKKKEELRKEEERVKEEERIKEKERIKEEERIKQEAEERITDTDKVEGIDIVDVVAGVDSMKLLNKSDFYDKKESNLVDSNSKVIIET